MAWVQRFVCGCLLAIGMLGTTGCAFFHELQPHRLHRWNRGNSMGGGAEAYYSISDPIPKQVDLEVKVHDFD